MLYFSAGVEAGTVVVTNKSFNACLKQSHEVVGMIKEGAGGSAPKPHPFSGGGAKGLVTPLYLTSSLGM